ncbi:MAG TPA: alpha/beta hydrolase-fold protein [Burkholderiaceae bacterium]|nr:alpha/beta hydrolase-fold protein [Burkholderiaceae bacterium]
MDSTVAPGRRRWLLGLAMTAAGASAQPLPQVGSGRIERLPDMASRHVAPRHVDVWLPADYDASRRHAVLYMHDGQMLFDAGATWNRQAWAVDRAVGAQVKAGRLRDTLVVGIWNHGPERYAEYFPEKALAHAPQAVRREYVEQASNGRSKADAYLRFIVEELKPEIDRRFATLPGREATFVAGSSMGGLISLYALCEHPQVFGGAAALSAHFVGRPTAWGLERVRNAALPLALLDYLSERLPAAGAHRVYIDRGTDALDALYAPALALAAELLRDKGYGPRDAQTRVVEGTGHSETDWARRIGEVLAFVMAPR